MRIPQNALITPGLILWNDLVYEAPDDWVKDLLQYKVRTLRLLSDGFPLSIEIESLPNLSYIDRKSYLTRRFKSLEKNTGLKAYGVQNHQAFYVTQNGWTSLAQILEKLNSQGIQVQRIDPYVFSLMPVLEKLSKDVMSESILWVSSIINQGARLVFYHQGIIRYVRYLGDLGQNVNTEITKTITYLEEEFLINHQDLKLLDVDNLLSDEFEKIDGWLEKNHSEIALNKYPETWILRTQGHRSVFRNVLWAGRVQSRTLSFCPQRFSFLGWGSVVTAFVFLMYQGYVWNDLKHQIQEQETLVTQLNPQWREIFDADPNFAQKIKLFEQGPWILKVLERLESVSLEAEHLSEVFAENNLGRVVLKIALDCKDEHDLKEVLQEYFTHVTKRTYEERQGDAFILEP